MPLPIPRLAPVTIATLPSRCIARHSPSVGCKHDANGTASWYDLACRVQRAASLVNPKSGDAVAGLVGRVQECAGRIECEMARLAAVSCLPADTRQPSRMGIDR